jgi:hypothetical protein
MNDRPEHGQAAPHNQEYRVQPTNQARTRAEFTSPLTEVTLYLLVLVSSPSAITSAANKISRSVTTPEVRTQGWPPFELTWIGRWPVKTEFRVKQPDHARPQ